MEGGNNYFSRTRAGGACLPSLRWRTVYAVYVAAQRAIQCARTPCPRTCLRPRLRVLVCVRVQDGKPEFDGVQLVAGDAQRQVGKGEEETLEPQHLTHIESLPRLPCGVLPDGDARV